MHENRARNTLGFLTQFRNLGRNDLPEGYTRYIKSGQPDGNVYDRYETDYEDAETPDREKENASCTPKKSCCEGRLSNLKKWPLLFRPTLLSPRPEFPTTISSTKKKLLQEISLAKSEEYSRYATYLFFKDPESVCAKRFQDRN